MIDDDSDVTLTLKTVLENGGYTVGTYYYGLVLTNIRMLTMNGFELYQKIREIDKNIRVRFLTASEINYEDFKEKVAPTIDDSQNCVIRKPIENQKLLNAVNELMK